MPLVKRLSRESEDAEIQQLRNKMQEVRTTRIPVMKPSPLKPNSEKPHVDSVEAAAHKIPRSDAEQSIQDKLLMATSSGSSLLLMALGVYVLIEIMRR